jgi:hypothetical protein
MNEQTTTRTLAADIECDLLKNWYLHYRGEFLIECERVGLKFIRDSVAPDDQERFTKAFDELAELGCRPLLLASLLYFFQKSGIYDFPLTFSNDGKLVPRFLGFELLPTTKVVKSRLRTLEQAAEVIEWLNDSRVSWFLSKNLKPPPHHDRVVEILRWYGDALKSWSKPRGDVIRSFGPIACCVYTQLSTKHFQFPVVSELIECLGYKPDPKRQHRKRKRESTAIGDQQRSHDPANDLSDDAADQSLERNFRIFRAAHPKIYRELRLLLARDHVADHTKRPDAINWEEVFAPPSKYDFQKWRSEPIQPSGSTLGRVQSRFRG